MITAPKIEPATAAPFSGCSVEPVREWWFVWNRAPIVDRITIAKREMTMQLHAFKAETTGFMMAGIQALRFRKRCFGPKENKPNLAATIGRSRSSQIEN